MPSSMTWVRSGRLLVGGLLAFGVLLSACSKSDSSSQATPSAGTAASKIAVTAGDQGFQPSRVTIPKGKAATLSFTRTSDNTCATDVVFPELNVKKALPLNQPVDIEVPAQEARTLTFQCGMGMYKSSVVVQ